MTYKRTRVGVFVDGGYFSIISDYFRYEHRHQSRIHLGGLLEHVTHELRSALRVPEPDIVIKQYYRGRYSAAEAGKKGKLQAERVWDDVLMLSGFDARYYPVRAQGEKAIDVMFALDAYKAAVTGVMDVAVLLTGDEDFVPLCLELRRLGVPVLLVGWELPDQVESDKQFHVSEELQTAATHYQDLWPLCNQPGNAYNHLFVKDHRYD